MTGLHRTGVERPPRSAPSLPRAFARAREAVTPALGRAADTLAPELRRIVLYHWGWIDRDGNPAPSGGGKALRPTLALLSAEAAGAPREVGVPGAVAVELVHDFSLLHDDVMDGDRERRHRPTAWSAFGVGPAICAGDALVLLATEVLLEQPTPPRVAAVRSLAAASQAMVAGQTADLGLEGRLDGTVEAYLAMSAGKTGALLGAAASIGAILADAPRGVIDALREFGCALGLAFQAADDWLGIWGRPERTGKPVASDVRRKKCSLPIVAALGSAAGGADELRALWRRDRLDEDDVARAVALIEAAGAEERTRAEAQSQRRRALACLERADVAPRVRGELREIADFVTARQH